MGLHDMKIESTTFKNMRLQTKIQCNMPALIPTHGKPCLENQPNDIHYMMLTIL